MSRSRSSAQISIASRAAPPSPIRTGSSSPLQVSASSPKCQSARSVSARQVASVSHETGPPERSALHAMAAAVKRLRKPCIGASLRICLIGERSEHSAADDAARRLP